MRMHRWFVTAIVLAVLTVTTPAPAKRSSTLPDPSSAALAAGFAHSLALVADATLWSWGDNSAGQLGDGTRVTRTAPTRVVGFGGTPVAVAAGAAHSLALGADGAVRGWGLNDAGQLGDATTAPRHAPTVVVGLSDAIAIAAGGRHSLALRSNGTLVAWGANDAGQLGTGTNQRRLAPTAIANLTDVVAIAAGAAHSLAVTSDGSLWTWGDNSSGQLGDGTRNLRRRPVRVTTAEPIAFSIAAGGAHSLAVGASGAVYAFGLNLAGQLGDGTYVTRLRPVRTREVAGATSVSAGLVHSLAVTTAGNLWTWGALVKDPRVSVPPTAVQGAAAGGAHNLALTAEGAVWSQGVNLTGQLGDGTRTSRATFVPISGPNQVWGVYPPLFSPPAGIFDTPQMVSISTSAPNAAIHYTTNGQDPTTSDLQIVSGGTVAIDRTTPLKARAFRNGLAPSRITDGVYTFVVATPAAIPPGGQYGETQPVALTTVTANATITYTLDASEPLETSTPYTAPIPISSSLTLRARAFRSGWNASASSAATYTFNFGTLATPVATPAGGTYSEPQSVGLSADAGARIHYTIDGSEPTQASTSYGNPIGIGATTTLKARAFRTDWTPSAVLTQAYVIQTPEPGVDTPPPDPATLAPPLPEEVLTHFADGVSFLYTGPNAIQRGVVAGAIEAERVAVVRGRVLTREGTALPGVRITVRGQSEVGYAVSRVDGMFDVALNAGGPVVIEYTRAGYLPAQRRVEPSWNAFAAVDAVRLVSLDSQVTVIDFSAGAPAQVARGSTSYDADGARQATLIVPEGGVRATMTLEDGSVVPALSTLSIRATEYTVGSSGEQAMPGPLPGTSGYTYAVELSADEAMAAHATAVSFDRPLAFYLENFVDFPIGGIVPVGYYDRAQARWIATDNGRVVRLIAIDNDRAVLDVEGYGLPATAEQLTALGVTEGELERAATLYQPGQGLWRVPVSHFTPVDTNWPIGLPQSVLARPGGGAPQVRPAPDSQANRPGGRPGQTRSAAGEVEGPCPADGSIIECQNQTLGETIAVAGTPFALTYRSSRATGPTGSRTIRIPVSGQQVPDSLKRIDVDIEVAGQRTRQSFAPATGLETTYVWDGLDRFGRMVIGAQDIEVVVTYVYPAVYYAPADYPRSFASTPGTTVIQDRARGEIGVQQTLSYTVDTRRRGQTPIAGWHLDVHHRYDPQSQTVYLGSGDQRTAAAIGDIISTIAGGGPTPVNGTSVPAEQAKFDPPLRSLAVGASGNVFVVDGSGILMRDRDGLVRRISTFDTQDDPQPALARAPGAGTYAAVRNLEECLENDRYSNIEIRYLAPTGTSSVLATIPISLPCHQPLALANVSGDLLLAAGSGFYRVDPSGEAVPMGSLPLGIAIWSIAGARDGTVYLGTQGQIWKALPSGRVDKIAGRQSGGGEEIVAAPALAAAGSTEDEPADDIRLHTITAMAVDANGNVVFADHQPGADTSSLKALTTTGTVVSLSGDEAAPAGTDGGLARAAVVHRVFGLTVTPGGETYYVDNAPSGARVRRLTGAFDRDGRDGELDVPAADGALIYRFTVNGVHRRTIDALTGVLLYSFEYDGETRLVAIVDRDGRRTQVPRGVNGDPVSIVSPFGVVTQLSVTADGSLRTVTDPEGNQVVLGYSDGGLLTSFLDANGHTHTFAYNARGRLIRDDDPAGGFQVLERTSETDRWTVTRTVADGGSVAYITEQLSTGATRRVTVGADGTETIASDAGAGTSTVTMPDGIATTSSLSPDLRFRFGAPITSSADITTPSGLTLSLARDRSVVLSNPEDPLSVVSVTDTTSTNGQVARSVFDAQARTITSTTPANRTTTTTLDANGRPSSVRVGTLTPATFVYNALGQLESRTQGNRTTTFTYDARGYVASVTDPLERTVRFTNDAIGRRLEQIFPDGRVAAFSYDGNGNLRSLTPPGRTAHQLTYTAVDRLESYKAPAAGGTAPETRYAFNLAGSPATVTRADGQELQWTYDAIGRLSELKTPEGTTAYAYQPGTGQLLSLAKPYSTLSYSYDGSLQTVETSEGVVQGTVDWTFDNDFRVSAERVRGSAEVTFGYDVDGLLTRAGVLALTRDAANGFLATAAVGSVTTTFDYNEFGEVVSESTAVAGASLFRADYTRDAVGRLSQRAETVEDVTTTEAYTYDLAGRLTDVIRDGAPFAHYAYDANGNRTAADGVLATHDPQDRVVTHGTRMYQHTAAGEVSHWTDTTTGETTTLTYDTQGNLLRVNIAAGTVVEYVADARNRRVQKRVNGVAVQGFLYQGQLRPVAEIDGSGTLVSRFVYGARATSPEYFVRAGATYRLVTDHIGSVRLVVHSGSGEVVQQMDYDAYGRVLQDTNPGFQPFGYAGGLYDPLTGLVRFGVRDYDPEMGRWLSKDPVGFRSGAANLYAYVGDDPINAVDPTGLLILHPGDLVDWVALGADIWSFIQCPGGMTGVAVAISVIGVLPGITAIGWLDDTADAARVYHHTFDRYVDRIMASGLRPGTYATPVEGLKPLSAQLELALDPKQGMRTMVLEINVEGLRKAGYQVPNTTRVAGRYGMPGGGYEMQFPYTIPAEFIRVIK